MQIKSNNPNFDSGPNIGGWSVLKDKIKEQLLNDISKLKNKITKITLIKG